MNRALQLWFKINTLLNLNGRKLSLSSNNIVLKQTKKFHAATCSVVLSPDGTVPWRT